VKAVDSVLRVHQAQVLTYMRLTRCPAGLLITSNVPKLIGGVKRLINPSICGRRAHQKSDHAGDGRPYRAGAWIERYAGHKRL
jgi:hypothetical protein